MSFQLPDLNYTYDELEPYFDAQTMEIHHSKHHAAYTNNLNAALEKIPALAGKPIEKLLSDLNSIPEEHRAAIRNHGGGFYNHSVFWTFLTPDSSGKPVGPLAKSVETTFGSFSSFKDSFSKTAQTFFGSGWVWLCKKRDGSLIVEGTTNQDCPLSAHLTPLLCIDLWEHAYYLKFQNRRAEYIKNWWEIVNWEEVERRFEG